MANINQIMNNIKVTTKNSSHRLKAGSALILTLFIMAGMLVVAMSGAYIVLVGIKASGVQSQSTRAYYTAESGMEHFLFGLMRSGVPYEEIAYGVVYQATTTSGGYYEVYFKQLTPLTFTSIGDVDNTRRSVEVRFGG